MNSLYGACGNEHFRYFMMEIAEGITLTGQYVIRWAEKYVNEYLNKALKDNKDRVIAIDTDSLYVDLSDLVQNVYPDADRTAKVNFLDKACKQIEKQALKKAFEDLAKNMNVFKNRIEMKREVIADRGVWTAKKRYILNVWDNEGVRYAEPKLKIMGIEAIKSSTPAACRDAFQTLFNIIITRTEDEAQGFIQDFRKRFEALPAEEKAFPRSVSSVSDYTDRNSVYKKGTPINSRAAILYNHCLKVYNQGDRYEKIQDGEKLKYIYLKVPNTLGEDVIGFPQVLPPEFGLHRYIDHDKQFEKAFLAPAKLIFDAIGWKVEQTASLEDFFGE